MPTIVLIRHGESAWNRENRFTGWTDVDLTEQGRAEAKSAGELLRSEGYTFDLAFTSVLKRAIRTLWIMLDSMDLMWRLNERHYGSLQGLNKAETAARHGEAQVKIWRRSYDIPPPELSSDDPRHPMNDPRYASIAASDASLLPSTESLKETVARVVPYWESRIKPEVRAGKRVLVAAHGNSLRALVKHLDDISNEDIVERNIPTGVPLVYELDDSLRAVSSRYLGDQSAIEEKMSAVAAQGKVK